MIVFPFLMQEKLILSAKFMGGPFLITHLQCSLRVTPTPVDAKAGGLDSVRSST